MDKTLQGRVIAITGAFGNLGLALAAGAVARGAQVAMLGRSGVDGVVLPAALGDALLLGGVDVASLASAEQAMARIEARFGRLDGLVNAAGAFRWQTLAEGGLAGWDQLYAANLRTAVTACKAALPLLRRADAGRIVNIGAAGALKAGAGMGAYAASKAGVARLTESLAEELKDAGVTVNAVLPSIIDTPQNRADMPDADVARWVTPAALAEVILFLLGDAAAAVTGALIPVTGRV
ncbi:SDR family NAD(P)-dependent oxidoreductase [Pseudomonas citronellolis]|uniref:SDR family NAD(P)-dependent oxidoreductase n=1 Tax=Pseudomonas citronellolis TaxID=53408 RepID=UPI0023E411B5|nr:SDR family NAD(P)-dependent oxidoreductase [Pseudomonas citronellolis]MDF3936161.1 SDR family NAD(P)-dependent oxidoreductase [Pseudomonas citronellolis]